ncbi:6798_t:CDS:10, partial [Dentiscutata erythropus]
MMIFCLVSGDPIRRAFLININRDMGVSKIRRLLIKDKNRFANIEEENLILWHVDIPIRGKDLGTTIKAENIKGGSEMSPFESVGKYFNESEHYESLEPTSENINIIVQLSPTVTKEQNLKFLQVNFEKSPAIPLITTFGHNFPFVGRTTTATCLTESFISRFKGACKGKDRNERLIFISAGAPGTGKTRNLIETIPMIRSCFPDFEISNETQKLAHLLDDPVQILMTYNDDLYPQNIEKTLGANSAIGLRILHHYFALLSSLDDFIDRMIYEFGEDPLKQKLNISIAINTIATIGSPFCKGDNDQEKRQYLKEVTLALGSAMGCKFNVSNIFIICHLAGTVLTLLLDAITSSSYRHLTLPTPLLLPVDINSLFEQLQLTSSWWLNSLLLRAIAYDIILPRGIEAFLEYISLSISKGISLSDIDYVQAARCARQKINMSAIPSLLAKEILVAIMLQSHVSRIDTVCTIDNTNYTWEYLESQGILILHPLRNEDDYYKVIMPYMYAEQLVSCCEPDKSLKNLSWLFSHDVSVDGVFRRTLLLPLSKFNCQPATIMLNEFYRSARLGKYEAFTFDVKDNQGQNLNLYNGNMIIRNTEGAPFDSFDIWPISNHSPWIIRCGQYKYFLNGKLTQDIINEEYAKTNHALPETKKNVEIPDNIILTDKSSFHWLFGIFATRLQFMMTNKININTIINVNPLKHIVGVGLKYAEKIIKNRPYKDENDMKEKLQLLRIPNETILNVLEA